MKVLSIAPVSFLFYIRYDDLQCGPYLYRDGTAGGAGGDGAGANISQLIKISASLVKVSKYFSALLEQ